MATGFMQPQADAEPQKHEASEGQKHETEEGQEVEAEEGLDSANEQEQALYEQFVSAVMDVIYPPETKGEVSPQILDDLRGNIDPQVLKMFEQADPPVSGNPADIVAVVAITLLVMVDQQMKVGQMIAEGRQDVDASAVLMEAGKSILEELIEVAESAKIHDFTDEEMESATLRAVDLYRTAAETMNLPGYNKEALTAAFGELMQADKAGNLSKVLPGLPGGAPMQEGEG